MLEGGNRLLQLATLEKREAEVHPQARHRRIERQSLAVKRHSLSVARLTSLEEPQMGVGFRARGLRLQETAPGSRGFGDLAVLLQRKRCLEMIDRGRFLVAQRASMPHRQQHQRSEEESRSNNPL